MIKYLAPLILLLAACDTYVEDERTADFEPIYLPDTEQEEESSDFGTIYKQNKGSLFAMEARAHRIGDILTVSFTESFQATKSQNAASTRSSFFLLILLSSLLLRSGGCWLGLFLRFLLWFFLGGLWLWLLFLLFALATLLLIFGGFLLGFFLGSSAVEGAFDEGRDIVFVVFTFSSWLGALGLLANQVLQEFVLLGPDMSEDLWHQVLEFLGFTGSSDDEEVFADRELDYTEEVS